jgi:hypothetical protein
MKGVVSGKLESLTSLIPGLSGRERIGLDEVDAEFRLHLSEKVMRGMERMREIREEFSGDGKIGLLEPMDKSIKRLVEIRDSLKGERHSHSPVFENAPAQDLDRLYDFDMTLLEEVDKLDLMVEEIATSDGYDAKVRKEIKELDLYLNEIEEILSKRGELLNNP